MAECIVVEYFRGFWADRDAICLSPEFKTLLESWLHSQATAIEWREIEPWGDIVEMRDIRLYMIELAKIVDVPVVPGAMQGAEILRQAVERLRMHKGVSS